MQKIRSLSVKAWHAAQKNHLGGGIHPPPPCAGEGSLITTATALSQVVTPSQFQRAIEPYNLCILDFRNR